MKPWDNDTCTNTSCTCSRGEHLFQVPMTATLIDSNCARSTRYLRLRYSYSDKYAAKERSKRQLKVSRTYTLCCYQAWNFVHCNYKNLDLKEPPLPQPTRNETEAVLHKRAQNISISYDKLHACAVADQSADWPKDSAAHTTHNETKPKFKLQTNALKNQNCCHEKSKHTHTKKMCDQVDSNSCTISTFSL